jgi:small-conductance mechanosensitive channel
MQSLAIAGGLGLIGLGAGWAVRRALLPRLARAAAKTDSRVDDLVLAALRGPIVVWGLLLGLYAGVTLIELPAAWNLVTRNLLITLVILSISWSLSRIAGGIVGAHATPALGALPSARLLTNLVQVVVLVLGGLVVLQTLGISITPLLTALGVGGLAVGLALQDTLANLFAGIHILVSRQLRPGDFIRLSTGEEGYVQDITWRYTAIRQLPNNLIIVPNANVASARTSNFNLPDPQQAVLVEVGVSYDSDLSVVERVTVDVGRQVMQSVDGGVPGFEPFLRYHTFGDSSIQFTVILRGRDYVSQYLVKHEFIKRLHQEYRIAGIEIPFPIRTVHLVSREESNRVA